MNIKTTKKIKNIDKTYRSVPEKIGIKIYGRIDGDRRDEPPWLVNSILFCYESDKHTGNGSEKKRHFLQHKEKHSNSKEAYTDGSNSKVRKVGYAAVFADITRRGALSEEASIHTAEIT